MADPQGPAEPAEPVIGGVEIVIDILADMAVTGRSQPANLKIADQPLDHGGVLNAELRLDLDLGRVLAHSSLTALHLVSVTGIIILL